MTATFNSGNEDFERFWAFYPRKEPSKRASFKCWQKVIESKKWGSPREILAGLYLYEFSSTTKFQPHATTWLNQRRWEIESSTPPPTVEEDRGDWMNRYGSFAQPTRMMPIDLFADQNLAFGADHGDD